MPLFFFALVVAQFLAFILVLISIYNHLQEAYIHAQPYQHCPGLSFIIICLAYIWFMHF